MTAKYSPLPLPWHFKSLILFRGWIWLGHAVGMLIPLDQNTRSPERYCTSPQSGRGHGRVRGDQPQMPAGLGLWHLRRGSSSAAASKGPNWGQTGRRREACCQGWGKVLQGNLLSRILQKVCPRPVSEEYIGHGVKSWSERVLQKQRAGWATGYPRASPKVWKERGGDGFPSCPAPATPPHHRPLQASTYFLCFLNFSPFPKKRFLCMEEPPPSDGACQLWAPDVLVESRHPSGCLLTPQLVPVTKTEGAACSDRGRPFIKPGQNAAGGTQRVGAGGERERDTVQLGCSLAPGSQKKPTNKRERQVCRGKGEEMRDMGQDEALDGKSCI